MFQIFIIIVLLVFSVFYLYLRRNFSYWKDRGVRYEEPNILLGNVSFIMRKSFFDFFYELSIKYPRDYVGIYLGWKPALVVQSPELARTVLIKDFDNFQDRLSSSSSSSDPLGSLNLFVLKNPLWADMRHEISPMFTTSRLKHMTDLINNTAKELVLKIKRDHIVDNVPVNLKELFSMYTSDIVGSTAFGIKVSALNDPNNPLWYMTKNMVKWTFWRGLELISIFYIPAVAAILRAKFFSEAATEYLKKLFWDVVKERKNIKITGKEKDFVNYLLKLKENLKLLAESDSQLADNLMLAQAGVFIIGSIETSATTLTYFLHELAHHPDKQEKLYEEINEAAQRTGRDILEYDDLLDLNYLSACLLETLRKWPPVAHLDRVSNKTCKLTDNLSVDPGTPVWVNVLALHYDPKNFPEPHKWKPERMKDIQETDNLGCSFLPFGAGPRFCIGKRLGVMQVRAAIAQIILKYKISPDPATPYEMKTDPYSALLSPLGEVKVIFEHRKSVIV